MQQTHAEVTSEVDATVIELDILKVEEQNIAEEIELSNQTLAFTNNDMKKARQIIAKAQALMSKAEPVQCAETVKLEQLATKSICIQELEVEKRNALEAVRARLAEVVNIGGEDLRQQVIIRAEENKRNKLFTLEAKLRSYAERQA